MTIKNIYVCITYMIHIERERITIRGKLKLQLILLLYSQNCNTNSIIKVLINAFVKIFIQ